MTSSPAVERGQILLLLRLLGDLILQRLGGVDDRGLRARLHFDELGAHVDALLQGRDEVLLRRDRLPQFVGFGGLLRALGVERGDIRRQLSEIGGENTGFALAQRRRDCVRPGDRRDGIEAMRPRARKRGLAPQDFRPRRRELGARAFRVGQGAPSGRARPARRPPAQREPLPTWIASTLPVSSGSTTLTCPVG